FQDLNKAAARETRAPDQKNPSLNVKADHIRACSFHIEDGVIPSNEGRGYVLRRIIRRAIRHGYQLGQKSPFFHRLVDDLDRVMGAAYPELTAAKGRVSDVLKQEEERFAETLETGMRLFEDAARIESRVIGYIRDHVVKDFKFFEEPRVTDKTVRFDGVFHKPNEDIVVETKVVSPAINVQDVVRRFRTDLDAYEKKSDRPARGYLVFTGKSEHPPEDLIDLTSPTHSDTASSKVRVLYLKQDSIPFDGRASFALYDTYGFPFDLTQDLCRERHIPIDIAAFDAAMDQQRERARAASKFSLAAGLQYSGGKTEFHGYDTLTLRAKVTALYREGAQVGELRTGESGVVVLDRTPFYAESGGQVGDRGELAGPSGTFAVDDTQKIQAEVYGHHGKQAVGTLRVGDTVNAQVDMAARQRTMWNHSATHLMHAALRQVLGKHVEQKGSLVDSERTRFDFSHGKPVSPEEIRRIEALVNQAIQRNHDVSARIMKYDEAIKAGALAFFGDKYGDEVRVLGMGDFSTELCGGTHVKRTGDIGFFKIVSESGVAAGIRRIEAVTGEAALAWVQQQEAKLSEVATVLKAPVAEATTKLNQVLENVRSLERELGRLKSKLASSQGDDLAAQAVDIKGAKVLAATLDGADAKTLRETMDKLKERLKSAAIVLGAVNDGKVALIAGVTSDLTGRVKAGELVNFVAQQVGGKGGGRPDMAQAGGTEPAKLAGALQSVKNWVGERV
ncbi:MAG: alanine--tRNA ligase, partial [Pseudomonadota bacterium]|nr:alanine--tRNA ligase [Pseudomonadota bacterium]